MFAGYVTRYDTIDKTSIGVNESVKIVKILEKITKIFLVGLAALIIGVVGYVLVVKFKEYQVSEAIRNGQVVVDQESHDWGLVPGRDIEELSKITMYVRNASRYPVKGSLVFLVTLDKSGLEENFLKKLIDLCRGDECRKQLQD